MISVSDKASGTDVGTITDAQLQILVDHLEETDVDDQRISNVEYRMRRVAS